MTLMLLFFYFYIVIKPNRMKNSLYIFVFLLTVVFLFSCQKEVTGEVPGSGTGSGGGTTGGGTGSSTYPYYFIGTIDGANIKYEADDLTSPFGCGISQPEFSLGFTDYDIYEGTVIMKMADMMTKNYIRVHILKYFDHEPTAAERVAMVRVGNYPYGRSEVSSSTVNGASIDYIDANGNNWFTEPGSQTGSTFNITELINNTDGTSGKIFKATFGCKFYDINGANPKTVTNAVIRGKILDP